MITANISYLRSPAHKKLVPPKVNRRTASLNISNAMIETLEYTRYTVVADRRKTCPMAMLHVGITFNSKQAAQSEFPRNNYYHCDHVRFCYYRVIAHKQK